VAPAEHGQRRDDLDRERDDDQEGQVGERGRIADSRKAELEPHPDEEDRDEEAVGEAVEGVVQLAAVPEDRRHARPGKKCPERRLDPEGRGQPGVREDHGHGETDPERLRVVRVEQPAERLRPPPRGRPECGEGDHHQSDEQRKCQKPSVDAHAENQRHERDGNQGRKVRDQRGYEHVLPQRRGKCSARAQRRHDKPDRGRRQHQGHEYPQAQGDRRAGRKAESQDEQHHAAEDRPRTGPFEQTQVYLEAGEKQQQQEPELAQGSDERVGDARAMTSSAPESLICAGQDRVAPRASNPPAPRRQRP
jgi:hypothetical protein